ncbi:MAG: hypothetical protein J6I65_07595 [Lachnospiraceae bacterium]|nr:hypothetical protein [Lachnospiraceae bacterium]
MAAKTENKNAGGGLLPDEIKMVKIKLFKDNKTYKDDVTVGVNGVFYKVQRGVEVEVPDFVAEVIRNSERQDAQTLQLIAEEAERASRTESKLG